MKRVTKLSIILFGLIMCLFVCGCQNFTFVQKEIIGQRGDGVMRLVTVESVEDSLFLRQKSRDISSRCYSSEEFSILKERMLATVQNPENEGVGLAAPQVGVGCNVVLVRRFDKEGEPFEFYINPKITSYSEEQNVGGEGCLSVPDMYGEVERSCFVTISYRDGETFRKQKEQIEGFTAVIFQHEIDHLNGVLFIDRAENLVSE